MKKKSCCFLGHRLVFCKKEIKEKLKEVVESKLKEGYKYFLMGNHGEFDEIALSVCRSLKQKYTDIQIFLIITNLNHLHSKRGLYDDIQTVVYDVEVEHFKKRITLSNKFMVDDCESVICWIDTNKVNSGAKTALKYALRQNKKVINIF